MLPLAKVFGRGQISIMLWLVASLFLVFPCRATGQVHPTDAELRRRFSAHRGEFEKLVKMAGEDQHVVRIASNFTWLDTDASWPRSNVGLSIEKWDAYRALFRTLKISGGIARQLDYPSSIFFLISGLGIVTSSSDKGIVYSPQSLSPTRNTLDDLEPTRRAIYFERISPNWYIFVDNNP